MIRTGVKGLGKIWGGFNERKGRTRFERFRKGDETFNESWWRNKDQIRYQRPRIQRVNNEEMKFRQVKGTRESCWRNVIWGWIRRGRNVYITWACEAVRTCDSFVSKEIIISPFYIWFS